MLFNSYPFIFLFLPIALIGYFVLGRLGNLAPVIWLALASLAFYSVSNWQFVLLLLASVAFNYTVGLLLISKPQRVVPRFTILAIGVAGDLLVLGYFKYAGFLAANLNAIFSTGFTVNILLPVGISFYTFTQIAFLVDAYRGNVARYALAALCAVRHLFSASDRGADPPPQGHDPAVRARGSKTAGSAFDPVRPDHLRHRPVQEDLSGRRHPAAGLARVRPEMRRRSIRPGSARWPTPSSSISISPAIPTWRSASR